MVGPLLKKSLVLLLFLAVTCTLRAQEVNFSATVITNTGRPVAGATVAFCIHNASSPNPCTNYATIYSNVEGTLPIANPTKTDGFGNVFIFAAPGTYDYSVSGNGVNTQTYRGVTLIGTSSVPAQTGTFIVSWSCGSTANCYTVKDDGQQVSDASFSSGMNVITTSSGDPPFCNGTTLICAAWLIAHGTTTNIGAAEFATKGCDPNNPVNCTYVCPQGVITGVLSAHVATVTSNCSASSSSNTGNGTNNFIWGTDDSTQLAAAFAAMDLQANYLPATLKLPCGIMLMGTSAFVDTFGTARQHSIGMDGCGPGNPTEIVPLPKMNCTATAASSPNGGSNTLSGCLLYDGWETALPGNISSGDHFRDFYFFGGGTNDKDSAATVSSNCGISSGYFTQYDNVWVNGWLWERNFSPTLTYGFCNQGATMVNSGSYGGGGSSCLWHQWYTVPAQITGGSCGASYYDPVTVDSGNMGYVGVVNSSGVYINAGSNATYSLPQAYGVYIASGYWVDTGSQIAGIYSDGGETHLYGSHLNASVFNNMYDLWIAGGSVHFQGVHTVANVDMAGGSFYDECGSAPLFPSASNTITSTIIFGSCSATGIQQTSGNWSTPSGSSTGQWGTSPSVGSCTGDATLEQCTITVGSSTIGASPVLTVTFPPPATGTPFLKAPTCHALQVGGTQPIEDWTTGTVTTTTAAFTFNGTPTASDTIVTQIRCEIRGQ